MTHALDTNADLAESLDWLTKNTNFPTFAEFCKNPDQYRAKKDELFESIQNASSTIKIKKMKYFWRGLYQADSLEKVQKIAEEEGYEGTELEMEPVATELLSDDPRKSYDVNVNVWPKGEFRAQGGVVANE